MPKYIITLGTYKSKTKKSFLNLTMVDPEEIEVTQFDIEEYQNDTEDTTAKSNSWVFTWNNYKTTEIKWPDNVAYAIWQAEVGLKKGTPHLQGFIQFKYQVRWAAVHKLVPWCKPRMKRSTDEKARDYCKPTYVNSDTGKTKEESGEWVEGPWEHGEFIIKKQGERNDIEKYRDFVRDGASKRQCMEAYPTICARFPKFGEAVRAAFTPPRDPATPTSITVYWGPPRVGKTRKAREDWSEQNVYVKKLSTGRWWDLYEGQTYVIIDEFDKIPFEDMDLYLDILDRGEHHVQIKGSTVPFVATHFVLTANTHPSGWHVRAKSQTRQGILRRIQEAIGNVIYIPEKVPEVTQEQEFMDMLQGIKPKVLSDEAKYLKMCDF